MLTVIVIEENGVRLRLNIVDTPGYGDQVNNDRWYAQLSRYDIHCANTAQLGPHRQVHQGPALGIPPQGTHRAA